MTAMLDSTEADYTELVEGINSFVKRVVVPLEEANRELLDNPRLTFDERGGYSAPVLDLMRQVREASVCPISSAALSIQSQILASAWLPYPSTHGIAASRGQERRPSPSWLVPP